MFIIAGMSLQGPTALPHGARIVASRAGDGEESGEVRFGGRRWGGLRRKHMRRVGGSLPERLFRRDSQLLGGSTVQRTPGGWVWTPSDADATPEALHAVIRYLQTGRVNEGDARDLAVVALATRWGMRAMVGT
jgi:hypothetical protein